VLDHSAAVRAIGTGPTPAAPSRSAGVPEPLASIVDHLDELDEAPEFISTADLAEVLDFDAAWLGRRLAELGCSPPASRRRAGRPHRASAGPEGLYSRACLA